MLLANAGVPMIALELPVMVIALIPIILLEAAIYTKFASVSWNLAWRGSGLANLVSTFVGIPIAWFVLVALQIVSEGGHLVGLKTPLGRLTAVILQSAWLGPSEKDLGWMIPAAACVSLIPFLIVTIVIERWILYRYWPEPNRLLLVRHVTVANMASYTLLAIFWGVQLYLAL